MAWALRQMAGVTVDDALTNAVGMELDSATKPQPTGSPASYALWWERRQRRVAAVPVWQYERPKETLRLPQDEAAAERLPPPCPRQPVTSVTSRQPARLVTEKPAILRLSPVSPVSPVGYRHT